MRQSDSGRSEAVGVLAEDFEAVFAAGELSGEPSRSEAIGRLIENGLSIG